MCFCDYSDLDMIQDFTEEEASNSLLYRNHKKYGTGLGTSVNWEIDDYGKGMIYSDFFPILKWNLLLMKNIRLIVKYLV